MISWVVEATVAPILTPFRPCFVAWGQGQSRSPGAHRNRTCPPVKYNRRQASHQPSVNIPSYIPCYNTPSQTPNKTANDRCNNATLPEGNHSSTNYGGTPQRWCPFPARYPCHSIGQAYRPSHANTEQRITGLRRHPH